MNRNIAIVCFLIMLAGTTGCDMLEEEKPCGDKVTTAPLYVYGLSPGDTIQFFNIWDSTIIYRFYYPSSISDIRMCPKEHIKVYNSVNFSWEGFNTLPNATVDGRVVIGSTGSYILFVSHESATNMTFAPENPEEIGLMQVYGDQEYGHISGYINISFKYPGTIAAADALLKAALQNIWVTIEYYEPK